MSSSTSSLSSASDHKGDGDGGELHVLAVDDSVVERLFLERMLKNSEYKGPNPSLRSQGVFQHGGGLVKSWGQVHDLQIVDMFHDLLGGGGISNPSIAFCAGLVTTVENGARALEYLGLVGCVEDGAQNKPDLKVNLIITDYCMPGMTGYELMKKIKEISYLKEIPVVIMSSENIPTRIDKCLEEGAKDFMLKPIQQSDVKRLRCHVKSFNSSSPGRLSMGETKRLLL